MVPEEVKFSKFGGATNQSEQQQFRGGHGLGYMGLATTGWVPVAARVPVLSVNNHPNPSQVRQKGFRKSRIFKDLQASLNECLAKTARLLIRGANRARHVPR